MFLSAVPWTWITESGRGVRQPPSSVAESGPIAAKMRLSGPGSVHPIRVAELESIHVYPRHRGRGAGEQLMKAFLAWAAEMGAQRATVTAYAANDGAQRFYARHGFALKSVILDLDNLPDVADR